MEELYKIKNDEVIVEEMICIFLLYPMIVFYMDASSVKLKRINMSESTCLFYAIVVAYTCYDWTINKDELNKLQKYNEIIDLSVDLNQDYYNKEKELTNHITREIQKEVEKEIKKKIGIKENYNQYLERYCGKTNYKKFLLLNTKII